MHSKRAEFGTRLGGFGCLRVALNEEAKFTNASFFFGGRNQSEAFVKLSRGSF